MEKKLITGKNRTERWEDYAARQFGGLMESYRDHKLRYYLEIKGLGHLYILYPQRRRSQEAMI